MTVDKFGQRQVNLGVAEFFRPEPESPAGNQIIVRGGFAFRGAFSVEDRLTAGDQTTTGFSSVTTGFKRYDLVYIDATGAVQILPGTEVGAAEPVYDGAPGFNLGPDLPDQIVPVAYVLVDEDGAVIIDDTDITQITGFISIQRDIFGYLVDKGLFGSPPAGASDVVDTPMAGETPGGDGTTRGIVTAPPENYVYLIDEKGDEIKHSTGARMYGRITESATVWTLTYFYLNASGAETSMDPSADTADTAPTDVRLVGVPKAFSKNDPARPLFDSSVARLSDQVVGTIPTATTTIQGKVLAALLGSPNPPRAGVFNRAQNAGVTVAGGNAPYHTINLLGGGLVSPSLGVLNFPDPGVGNIQVLSIQTQVSGVSLSFSVPGNTLLLDGESLFVIALFNANGSHTFSLRWGGVTYAQVGSPRDVFGLMHIVRTGASAQNVGSAGLSGSATTGSQAVDVSTGVRDLTAAQVVQALWDSVADVTALLVLKIGN